LTAAECRAVISILAERRDAVKKTFNDAISSLYQRRGEAELKELKIMKDDEPRRQLQIANTDKKEGPAKRVTSPS
jgi:hypothetical protein